MVALFLLIALHHAVAQQPLLASPVNLGIILLDETNPERIKGMCEFYQFTEDTPEEDYAVYTSPQGDKLKIKITKSSAQNPTTEITVTSSKKLPHIKQTLTGANFKKSSKGTYTRGSKATNSIHTCTPLTPKSVLLTKTFSQPMYYEE